MQQIRGRQAGAQELLTLKRQLIAAEMRKSLGASEVRSDGAYPQGDL
jgi:hypothetical protein